MLQHLFCGITNAKIKMANKYAEYTTKMFMKFANP